MNLNQPQLAREFRESILQHTTLEDEGFLEIANYLQSYPSLLIRSIEQNADKANRSLKKEEKAQIERLQKYVQISCSLPEELDILIGSGFNPSNRIRFTTDDVNLEKRLLPFDFRCYQSQNEHMLYTLKDDMNIGGIYLLFEEGVNNGSGLFGQVMPVIDKNKKYGLFIDVVQRGEKKKTPNEWINQGDRQAFSSSIVTSIYLAKLSGFDYVVFGEFSTQRFAENFGMKKERVFPKQKDFQRKLGYPSMTPEGEIPEGYVYTNSLYRSNQTRFPVLKLNQLKL